MPVAIESTQANAPAPMAVVAPNVQNVSGAIGSIAPATGNTTGGNIVSGAAKGAAAGSILGPWGAAAGGVIGGVVGGVFGSTTSSKQQQQLEAQGALDQQQLQYNEQQTAYGEQTQQQLWNGTNSLALADEAAQQGFNPALIYGGGGGGGSTGSGSASVSAPQAANAAQETTAEATQQNANTNSVATAENIQQQNAQITNTQASTANITASTALIAQQTNNAQYAEDGIKLQNEFQSIQNQIQSASASDQIDTINQNFINTCTAGKTMIQNMKIAAVNSTIAQDTLKTVIASYNANLKNTIADTLVKETSGRLNVAEAQGIAIRLQQGQQQLQINSKGQDVSIENTNTMAGAILKSAGIQALSGIVKTAVAATE
jgi:hypothetical protein